MRPRRVLLLVVVLLVAVVVGAILRLVIDRGEPSQAADTASEACPAADTIPTRDRVETSAAPSGRSGVLCTYVSDGRTFWWTSATPVSAEKAAWLQTEVRRREVPVSPYSFSTCVAPREMRPVRRALLFVDGAVPALVLEDGGRCGAVSASLTRRGRLMQLAPTRIASIDDLTRAL